MSSQVTIQDIQLHRQICDICGRYEQMVARCARCKKHACAHCRGVVRNEDACEIPLRSIILSARGFN